MFTLYIFYVHDFLFFINLKVPELPYTNSARGKDTTSPTRSDTSLPVIYRIPIWVRMPGYTSAADRRFVTL